MNLYGVGAGLLGPLGDAVGWPLFVIVMILVPRPPCGPTETQCNPSQHSARSAAAIRSHALKHGV